MKRRTLLATAGATAAAAAAGCLSDAGGGEPTDTTTDEPTDRTTTHTGTTTGTTDASVSLDAYQRGVVVLDSPDSIGVREGDSAFLYLSVESDAENPPAYDEFEFDFDGKTYPPESPDDYQLWRERQTPAYENGSGWLLFSLPESGDADDARLSWPGGEWQAGESLRAMLAAPLPDLSVEYDFPETVVQGESPDLSITVENEGDVDARYVAGLNRSGPRVAYAPIEAISMRVPAGETKEWTLTDDYGMGGVRDERVDDGDPDMTYHLDGADVQKEWPVRVVSE